MVRSIIVIAYDVTSGGWDSCGYSGSGGAGNGNGRGSDAAPKSGLFFVLVLLK